MCLYMRLLVTLVQKHVKMSIAYANVQACENFG